MTTFKLSAGITVSAYTTVEAETEAEAIEIARDREAAIGGHGTGIEDTEYWIIDDADGMPESIRVEGKGL